MVVSPKTITVLGVLATLGAFMGVLADIFSAWSLNPNAIDSARGLKAFLSVTGLNLPLMTLFAITTWVLVTRGEHPISL